MKKFFSAVLVVVLILTSSSLVLAKPKKQEPTKSAPQIDTDFFGATFNMDPVRINYFSRFQFTSEELSLVLYLYSVSGRPVSDGELDFIVRNKGNWPQLAWYFGMPPIILKDTIFTFRHPARVRHLPPLGNTEYKYEVKGAVEEKVEVTRDKYEYVYRNKPLGIEEKLEITKDKYSYQYKDRNSEEKLEIKFPSYEYEYKYKEHKGKEIKYEGIGTPLTPAFFYQQLKVQRKAQPELHFSININITM